MLETKLCIFPTITASEIYLLHEIELLLAISLIVDLPTDENRDIYHYFLL